MTKKSSQNNQSEIIFSPDVRKRSVSQIGNISAFKLRSKRTTVFYDEFNDDIKS